MSPSKNLPLLLVVDDEPIIIETFKTIFKKDFQVVGASGAEQAFERIAQFPVGLVFLDVNIAGCGGLEILRRVKEQDSRMPVIMVSGVDNALIAKEAERLGAYAYLPKPFDLEEVTLLAHQAIKKKSDVKE